MTCRCKSGRCANNKRMMRDAALRGGLAAAARTTDEEEAANEDKTIIEAIHNTKVGVRHEMTQAKRSVFPNVHILHSRSWRNWGFRRFSHEKTAHTGQFCAVK